MDGSKRNMSHTWTPNWAARFTGVDKLPNVVRLIARWALGIRKRRHYRIVVAEFRPLLASKYFAGY